MADIYHFLGTQNEATLPGSSAPIGLRELREAQISLCQHAPAVTKGVDAVLPLELRWFEVEEQFRFSDTDELTIGNAFPSYHQLVAHLSGVNARLEAGEEVPTLFQSDCDIILAVQLRSSIEWFDAAVDANYVSFTCLGPTTRKLTPGRVLLFAA